MGVLEFLLLGFPIMSVLAAGIGILGLAMGALAGLPDHLLRRRPDRRPSASALAVIILTALVTTTRFVGRTASWPTKPTEITTWSTAAVAGAAITATAIVIVLHRRRWAR
ncbi:hypothetical protein C5E16_06600 [Clavibacter michiganensis]|uniref:Uncharacterized protein n=1 Tax=Clavibacter michiganensis TaxID=28447 RepID=A0A2S5VUM9_9MICO|nr:hypothetical protein [Clavibacter michiganensis]PPF68534.1 hypothetical protein C5E16_06600 [Clavibacter michiganensis]